GVGGGNGDGGGGPPSDAAGQARAAAPAAQRGPGGTRSVSAPVASPLAVLRAGLAGVAARAARDPLVLGAHLEGPFLAPARRGAHHVDYLCEPDQITVDELIEAGGGALRQITIAPELPGADNAIDCFLAA